jgi:uncharacterized protein
MAEKPFPKPRGLVNDFAQVIPPDSEQKLEAVTNELLQKTGTAVVVVTMPDIGGAEYNDYANRLYSAWGIGQKGADKGVLVFVTVQERKMRIETGYGVEGILPDGLVGEIRDRYMIPYFKANRFGEGLLNGTTAIAQVIAKDAGASLSGQPPTRPAPSRKRRSVLSFLPYLIAQHISMMETWVLFQSVAGALSYIHALTDPLIYVLGDSKLRRQLTRLFQESRCEEPEDEPDKDDDGQKKEEEVELDSGPLLDKQDNHENPI